MKIGFFPMTADVIHCGHILALAYAKSKCDYLIVGLNVTPSHKRCYTVYIRKIRPDTGCALC